jgi:hypothetical protein
MTRFGLMGLALLYGSACASSNGQSDASNQVLFDAGPVAVNLDGGGPPAAPPDGKALCPAGTCNYQAGTGCTGTKTSCLPSVSGNSATPTCFTPGNVPGGAACATASDCVAGHICAGGACRKLCCGGDWTGCDSASDHCLETLEYGVDGGVLNTGAMLCYPVNNCDALQPSTCTPPSACLLADATGATACLPGGTGTAGQPCPCKGGFTCIEPPGKGPVCVRLCKAVLGGGDPYCQPGEGICTHFTRDPPGVGECQPPATP